MFVRTMVATILLAAGAATPSAPTPAPAEARVDAAAPTGSGAASARRPRPSGPLSLRMRLDVPGETAASGTVVLRAGETTWEQPVSLPQFDLVLPDGAAAAMVSVELRMPGARYATILGSRGLLARRAGTDALLVEPESDRLRLTAASTALHYYVGRAAGGLPGSDAAFEDALRSMDGALLRAAVVFTAVADDLVDLPAGFPDAYALLEDQVAYGDFLLNAGEWYTVALADVVARPGSAPLTPAGLANSLAILRTIHHDNPTLRERADLLFRDGARFRLVQGKWAAPAATPGADILPAAGGAIDLVADAPLVEEIFDFVEGGLTRIRREHLGNRYRRLVSGERHDLWLETSSTRVSYPDRPDLATRIETLHVVVHTARLDDPSTAFTRRDIAGRWIMRRVCPPEGYSEACGHDEARLDRDGTGAFVEVGHKVDGAMVPVTSGFSTIPLTWRLDHVGALTVRYPGATVRYWRVARDGALGDRVVREVETDIAGQRTKLAGHELSLHMPSEPTPGSDAFAGTWAPPSWDFYDAWRPPTRLSRLEFREDGRAIHWHGIAPPNPPSWQQAWRMTWTTVDFAGSPGTSRRLYWSNFWDENANDYASCEDAYADGAKHCVATEIRYFRPILVVGDRVYGIRHQYSNYTPAGQPPEVYRSHELSWFERAEPIAPLPRVKRPVAR